MKKNDAYEAIWGIGHFKASKKNWKIFCHQIKLWGAQNVAEGEYYTIQKELDQKNYYTLSYEYLKMTKRYQKWKIG